METDRVIVPDDEKKRILDLSASVLPVPSVGIYDGDVRYYKANLEWAKIIEGHLSWLASIAAWQDAENEGYEAIQQISIFLEGIEGTGMSIDYEAMKEAMCEAIECGAEKIAARYLSGTVDNLAGGDIVLTPGQAPVVVPPGQAPDDESTTTDEESRSGGAQSVYLGFRQLILDLHSWITLGLSDADIYTRMKSKYKCEPSMEAAITVYKTAYQTPPPSWTTPVITNVLASKIYCKGNSIETIADYIITTWDAEVNALLGIANGLSDFQLNTWFNNGKNVPSTDYLAYSCTKTAPFQVLITANPQTVIDTHPMKKYHRYEITIEGYWTDAAGRIQDAWWTKGVGVSENFSTSLLNLSAYLAVKTYPTSFEAPYDPVNHRYKWTMETGTVDLSITFALTKWGVFVGAISSPTGGFTIDVRDMGEYTA